MVGGESIVPILVELGAQEKLATDKHESHRRIALVSAYKFLSESVCHPCITVARS